MWKNDYFKSDKQRSYKVHPVQYIFECLESGPNDSTWVRRLTDILRRARVKIFILAYESFWFQLSRFSSYLNGHHRTKTAKPTRSCRKKYPNFYFKSSLQRARSYRYERCLISPERTCHKIGKTTSFKFSVALGGDSFTSVRVQDENSGATDSGWPLRPNCGPFPACVGQVFKHI
jgi:hypothetical protein